MNLNIVNALPANSTVDSAPSTAYLKVSSKDNTFEKLIEKFSDNGSDSSTPLDLHTEDDSDVKEILKKSGLTDDQIKNLDKDSLYALLGLILAGNQSVQVKSDLSVDKDSLSQDITKVIDYMKSNNIKEITVKTSSDGINSIDIKLNTEDGNSKAILTVSNVKSNNSGSIQDKTDKNFLPQDITKIVEYMKSNNIGEMTVKSPSDDNSSIDIKSSTENGNTTILITTSDQDTYNTLKSQLSSYAANNNSPVKLDYTSSTSTGNSDNASDDGDNSKSGDENVLNKILNMGEDTNNKKIAKAVNFMTQLNTVNNVNNSSVENEVQNLNVNKNSFAQDIIKSIQYMEANNTKEMTVKVLPEGLGKITIDLVMENGKMTAVLTASNKNTYNLLNSNIQDLSNKLQNNDIKIQNFSLNLYHEDTTFFKRDDGRNRRNQSNGKSGLSGNLNIGDISDDEEISMPDIYGESSLNMLA